MQTPQFTFSDLPLKPEQKEGEIDYSDAKVRCFRLAHYITRY
jgi:lipoate-protein ligase A